MIDLKEFVDLLEDKREIIPHLREKILKALIEKNPYYIPLIKNAQ